MYSSECKYSTTLFSSLTIQFQRKTTMIVGYGAPKIGEKQLQ